MNVEEFEGCCTARIFTDLGDSRTSQFGYHAASYDRLRREVVSSVKNAARDGAGIITAIVTNEQVTGAKVLKDLGFTGTGMASKTSHREVQIELYYLHCKDWVEPEKPADIVAPEAPVAAPQPFAAARNPAPQLAPLQPPVEAPVRARDANGRFAPAERGYAVFTNMAGRLRYVSEVYRNHSVGYSEVGRAKLFTRAEFDALVLARRGEFNNELTFQPI